MNILRIGISEVQGYVSFFRYSQKLIIYYMLIVSLILAEGWDYEETNKFHADCDLL